MRDGQADLRVHRISASRGAKALLRGLGCVGGLLGALGAPLPARADALADVQLLRESGCGGIERALGPVRHAERLDWAAAQWATGASLTVAAERMGLPAEKIAGVHVSGAEGAMLQSLRRTSCPTLMNPHLTDVGVYQHGREAWLVLVSSYAAPAETVSAPRASAAPWTPSVSSTPTASRTRSPAFAARVLELVNEARVRGTSCGPRAFAPAGPVRLSATLEQVAYGHALDMAEHVYFEHRDLAGRTPADRVRGVGYREKLVGENIAYGPESPEEVVRGWLDSPGHCENIMDPRFAEMGIAYASGPAPGQANGRGLYWVQVLADPKI